MVAFNKGDGQDSVSSTSELAVNDTLSLGGGIRYADLALRKAGSDLVLETGSTNGVADQLTFRNWYGAPRSRSFLNMQVVAQAMADFDATSGDSLRDNKVETFDFVGITDRFDSERAGNPGLTRWAIDRALAQFHLSGSDAQAIGGDLAYYAGMRGSLTGMALAAAQGAFANPQFGAQAQSFASVSNLQGGGTKLA